MVRLRHDDYNFYPRPPCGGRPVSSISPLPASKFLSTSPLRGTTRPAWPSPRPQCDFYPRPPCGGRHRGTKNNVNVYYFYPRPPCGGRQVSAGICRTATAFLSTSPLRGTTGSHVFGSRSVTDFYPRPPCGGRRLCFARDFLRNHFYPRPPCGGRLAFLCSFAFPHSFLSTSPLRGTTG